MVRTAISSLRRAWARESSSKLEQAVAQMTETFHVLELQGALPLETVGDGNLLDDPRGPGPVTAAPSSTACPDLACPSPAAMRIRVVFPQPVEHLRDFASLTHLRRAGDGRLAGDGAHVPVRAGRQRIEQPGQGRFPGTVFLELVSRKLSGT